LKEEKLIKNTLQYYKREVKKNKKILKKYTKEDLIKASLLVQLVFFGLSSQTNIYTCLIPAI